MTEVYKQLLIVFNKDSASFARLKKDMRQLFENDTVKSLEKGLSKTLVHFGKEFTDYVVNAFKTGWESLEDITSYSRLSSSRTRELAFTYGFSGSQAYGFDQAMSIMGFESEEDLMYATKDEIAQFRDLFDKYTNWYEGIGKEELQRYRDFEIELRDFKQQVQMTVVDFFMDNSDEIKELIDLGFVAAKAILSIADFLLGDESDIFRSDSERQAAMSDIMQSARSQYSTSNQAYFNNVFNVNSSQEAALLTESVMYSAQAAFPI